MGDKNPNKQKKKKKTPEKVVVEAPTDTTAMKRTK